MERSFEVVDEMVNNKILDSDVNINISSEEDFLDSDSDDQGPLSPLRYQA